jgi:hypothetical protein
MSGWGDNEQEQKIFDGAGQSDIVRLSMKEAKYTIRVLGTYKLFRTHWVNAVNRSVNCDGLNCPICQAGERGQLKYVVNIIDKADGKVKLWEFGRRVKVAIQNIADNYGDPIGYDLIVIRKGMGADDTVYTVLPARDPKPLTTEETALPKYDLDKLYANTPAEKVAAYLKGEIPARVDNTPAAAKEEKTQSGKPSGSADLPTLD